MLELLDEAIKNYDNVGDYDFGYMHAMYLLAQFREKKTFPLVIQIAALPEKYVAPLLGGLITGDLHKIIASVYDGDLAAIQQLIEEPSLYEWCRGAALQSLLVLVKADMLDRRWVINYFKSLFSHPVFKEDYAATTNLVRTAYDLYPAELYDDIKLAFEQGRVDTFSLNMEDVDRILSLEEKAALEQCLTERYYGLIHDVLESMGNWFCFKKEEPSDRNSDEFQDDEPESMSRPRNHSPVLPYYRETPKVGRNAPCPCGSGKKYEKCCLHATMH